MNILPIGRKTALTLILAASMGTAHAANIQSTPLTVVASPASPASELRLTAPDIQRHSLIYAMFPPDTIDTRLDEAAMRISYDQVITHKVVARLSADAKLDGQITVFTSAGVVSLSGKMKSVAMINRAIELVRSVKDVKAVVDGSLVVS